MKEENFKNEHLRRLKKPKQLRWRGRSYKSDTYLELAGRRYYIIKFLSTHPRQRLMVFDEKGGPHGEMRCIIGLDGRNLSTKFQPPGLIDKLQRISCNTTNLPAIIEYHPRGNRVYLITPWIEGENLHDHLNRIRGQKQSKISIREACYLTRGLAHALKQFHNLNIVHGDLTPRNLILQRNPNRLQMIDFGSAWLVEQSTTKNLGDGNRAPYTAPELLFGGFTDNRADQFSLGAIFYELLTYKTPYANLGGKVLQYKDKVEYKAPSTLLYNEHNKLPREVWKLIDKICNRCLQLDIDKRYETPGSLLNDFEELKEALRVKRSWFENSFWYKSGHIINKLIKAKEK